MEYSVSMQMDNNLEQRVRKFSKVVLALLLLSGFFIFSLGVLIGKSVFPSSKPTQRIASIPTIMPLSAIRDNQSMKTINLVYPLSFTIPDSWLITEEEGVPEGGPAKMIIRFSRKQENSDDLLTPINLEMEIQRFFDDKNFMMETYNAYNKQFYCRNVSGFTSHIISFTLSDYTGERCSIITDRNDHFTELLLKNSDTIFYLSTLFPDRFPVEDKLLETIISSLKLPPPITIKM